MYYQINCVWKRILFHSLESPAVAQGRTLPSIINLLRTVEYKHESNALLQRGIRAGPEQLCTLLAYVKEFNTNTDRAWPSISFLKRTNTSTGHAPSTNVTHVVVQDRALLFITIFKRHKFKPGCDSALQQFTCSWSKVAFILSYSSYQSQIRSRPFSNINLKNCH